MASMIISTYTALLPQNTMIFCAIVLCIGFFGIYLPYQEHKKKKKRQPPSAPNRTATPKTEKRQLEQLKTLKDAGLLTEAEYQEKKRSLK